MMRRWSDCGSFIKEKRLEQRMTQAELATKLVKSSSLISRIESGERRPSQRELLQLSQIFSTRIQVLQQKAGYTPEFDWYASFSTHEEEGMDLLANTTDAERDELRRYLLYIRFREAVSKNTESSTAQRVAHPERKR